MRSGVARLANHETCAMFCMAPESCYGAFMDETPPSVPRVPAWGYVLAIALLVGLVAGAYWFKTGPAVRLTGGGPVAVPESSQTLLARGIGEHNAGNLDLALDLNRKVLQRDPAHAQAHYNIAQIHMARDRPAQAQSEYEAALKAAPDFLDARVNLGAALYRQRRFAEAVREFEQAVQAAPNHPLALFDLGITVLELGRLDEAIRWLNRALREDPKHDQTHYYLGVALERKGRLGEATAALRQALALNPRHADAYLALSKVYQAQGEQRLAREALAKAVELAPHLKK